MYEIKYSLDVVKLIPPNLSMEELNQPESLLPPILSPKIHPANVICPTQHPNIANDVQKLIGNDNCSDDVKK